MDKSSARKITCISIITVLLAIVLIMLFFSDSGKLENVYGELTPYGNGWTYSDGTEANLAALIPNDNGEVVFSKQISADNSSRKSICFRSKNIFFSVYMDNTLIYDFNPTVPKLYGKSYGSYIHCVEIPHFMGKATITFRAKPIYDDKSCYFNEMELGKASYYTKNVFSYNLPKFIISFMMLVVGIVLFTIGLMFKKYRSKNVETISLGVFAIFAACWTSTETLILQLVTQNPSAVHFLNYVSLFFIPYPAAVFVASITGNPKSKGLLAVTAAVAANSAVNVILTLCGIMDYHQMLNLTHFILAFSVGVIIYLIVCGHKHNKNEQKIYAVFGAAFLIVVLFGFIDLLRYRFNGGTSDSGTFVRIGLLIFIIILAGYTLKDLLTLSQIGRQAEMMKKLAYKDALTGIPNRVAFVEYEKMIISRTNGEFIFVQFDINNLKKVNDIYGHSFGDKHIIAAADVITKSFGKRGKCYRTGGDEFIAVLAGEKSAQKLSASETIFNELIEKYNAEQNPPIKLEIAYGTANYSCGDQNPEAAEREADKKMYELKKQMKEKAVVH